MTTYLVATLSIWVLVDAADETAAREAALPTLHINEALRQKAALVSELSR